MAIPLVGPDGKEYDFDGSPADLQAALKQGYRQGEQSLGDEAKAFATGPALAGAEGVAGGLTAGLSDVLLAPGAGAPKGDLLRDPSGDVGQSAKEAAAREATRLRRENPLAHDIGEVAGAVASPLNKIQGAITGGIGATTALGRIGANVVGGGAVGTLYGAGNAVSDAALGDQNLTAEKLFAGAGLGALLGGGGAGLGTAIGEGGRAVFRRGAAAAADVADPLAEFADERWLKAGGGIQNDIKKIPEGERAAVADAIRTHMSPAGKFLPETLDDAAASLAKERDAVAKQMLQTVGVGDAGGLAPKMNQDEALGAIGKAIDENGARVGEVLKKADAMGATPSYSQTLARIDAFEAGLNPA